MSKIAFYSPTSERLVILDALRGFAMFGILFVNIIAFFDFWQNAKVKK